MRNLCRLIICLLALSAGNMATAQKAGNDLTREQPEVRPSANQEREALLQLGQEFAIHLVRVEIHVTPVIKRIDNLRIEIPELKEGVCGGIVVSPDPHILISNSALRFDHAGLGVSGSSGAPEPPKRRYSVILSNGSRLPAEVWRKDRNANVILLRLQNESEVPDELQHPINLTDIQKPTAGEFLGVISFVTPDRSAQLRVFTTKFSEASVNYERPVLGVAGIANVGMPIINSTGSLIGIINLPSPDEKTPAPRVDLDALQRPGGTLDPQQWAAGLRRPILMSNGDLLPLGETLLEPPSPSAPILALGLSVVWFSGEAVIYSVEPDSPASRETLVPGERIIQVNGTDIDSTESLELALSDTLTSGPISMIVERDGRPIEVFLTPQKSH